MIYKQHHLPQDAKTGSVWLCPNNSFKRVLSRGGAWENVNLGSTHPDEKDHEDEQTQEPGPETEPGDSDAEVSGGTGESASGDGDDGQATDADDAGEKDESVTDSNPANLDQDYDDPERSDDGEGIDANGSPVVS